MRELLRWVALTGAFIVVLFFLAQAFSGGLGLWEFLAIIIIGPILIDKIYKMYCIHEGVPVRGAAKGHAARSKHDVAAENARFDELGKRLERIEAALGEVKRENESLSEDYRFIQRVLEKDK